MREAACKSRGGGTRAGPAFKPLSEHYRGVITG